MATRAPIPAADRHHAHWLIMRAVRAAELARAVAHEHELGQAAERLAWAVEFLQDAAEQAEAGSR